MRYKELSLNKIEELKQLVRLLESNTSKYLSSHEVHQNFEQVKNKIDELQSMINIEPNDYPTDSNFLI